MIETRFGRIVGLSSAGAHGPMQFLPSTFAAYGDGGDILSPHDSIMAAGRHLAANGFAGDRDHAIFRYNNSDLYVRAVNDYADSNRNRPSGIRRLSTDGMSTTTRLPVTSFCPPVTSQPRRYPSPTIWRHTRSENLHVAQTLQISGLGLTPHPPPAVWDHRRATPRSARVPSTVCSPGEEPFVLKVPEITAVRLTAATVALLFVVAGCGSKEDSSSSESSSATSSASSQSATSETEATSSEAAAPAAGDHSNLLMTAEDVSSLGETFTSDNPPLVNPNGVQGVAQAFQSSDKTATIGDTILVFADPAEATKQIANVKETALATMVTGAPEPLAVGTDGVMAAGTSPDGTKAVTVLMFTEGTAYVTLEFDSAPDNPVPPDFAQAVAQKQLDAIKAAG